MNQVVSSLSRAAAALWLAARVTSALPAWLQIHQYLITKTAKDCSIMVALVPSSDKEEEDEG